ncbi:MAG: 2-oxoacid:acceptor oxidoreductase family protein [Endomicrobiales bacterium]|nr:2-oxoacid:acceptor oxidoreductase family protein [Endomicrobiales bacterium]
MKDKVIIAGFGGQGVLLAGMVLAQTALEEGLQTTWFPAYGAEMRGGSANSTVVISDEEIGSPVAVAASVIIAMSDQGLGRFLPRAEQNAVVIVNSSLIKNRPEKDGVEFIFVPASDMADTKIGDVRMANLIMIGAYVKKRKELSLESAKKACAKAFPGKPKILEMNMKALELGFNYAK